MAADRIDDLGPLTDQKITSAKHNSGTPMIVPINATAPALEIGILEMLGQKQLPPPMQPKNFVLT